VSKEPFSKKRAIAVLAVLVLFSVSTLSAQTTYDFYVADEEYGTGKFHSGTVTRNGNNLTGSIYSWRHQRWVDLSGNLATGVVTATWTEAVAQRIRVKRRWVTQWVNVLQSSTINIQNAAGGLPVTEENRRVLIGSWQEVGGDGQSGVFGGYVP